MAVLTIISLTLSGLMFLLCFYQIVYIIVSLFGKPVVFEKGDPNKFAILISARNEENVIPFLLENLKEQDYPKELYDVYVVADNCTDKTAEVSRAHGAKVYERNNTEKRGKGYALDYLLHKMGEEMPFNRYDGYLIIDADNLLEKDFITEINKTFSNGYRVVTSFRNSKNFAQNWKASGSALMLLRETMHLNNARMILGNSCTVAGTGFVVGHEIIERMEGWNHYLLTEDIEFSLECVSMGIKIGYAHTARLYDEQPTTMSQLWNQRKRWSKGYLQAYGKYFKSLCRAFKTKNKFSAYDMLMNNLPIILLSTVCSTLSILTIIVGTILGDISVVQMLIALGFSVVNMYGGGVLFGFLISINVWKDIRCTTAEKIRAMFTLPFVILIIFLTAIVALFRPVEWKAIEHTGTVTLDEIKK